jgi:succinate dehydrogenase / fumarate reductase flavoprotein subunit
VPVADLLAADGHENVRALQRAVRNTMTEYAGVVRDEQGLIAGLRELDEIEVRAKEVGIHPDIAGFQDLAHAFDLKASLIAARATLATARERRETRGCHNRSDYPDLDPALQVNLVWSPSTGVTREDIPPVPDEIAALIRTEELSTAGKLVE